MALARALVKEPKYSAGSTGRSPRSIRRLRSTPQLELVAFNERVSITFIMVTPGQEETMSEDTATSSLMRDSAVYQVGTPR